MSCIIRLWHLSDGSKNEHFGRYLKEYDPTISGVDPDGTSWCHLVTTEKKEEALKIETIKDALDLTRRVDPRHPVRLWDRKPNRPITAFTLEVITLK